MELTFLLCSFQRCTIESALHIQHNIVPVHDGVACRCGLQARLLFAQDLKASVELFVGDGAFVGLERDRTWRLIVPQFDFGLDLDGRGKCKRFVLLNLDSVQRRNFNKDWHNSRLADGLVVEVRHETSDHVLFHCLGIAFFQQGQRYLARPKTWDVDLAVQLDIGAGKPLRDLIGRHLNLEGAFHRS